MLNGEVGYGDGYGEQAAAVLQELLRRRGHVGARLQDLHHRAEGLGRQPARRQQEARRQRRVPVPVPGHGERQVGAGRARSSIPAMVDDTYKSESWRYSAGIAVLWVSPFGPLKISLAKALERGPAGQEAGVPVHFRWCVLRAGARAAVRRGLAVSKETTLKHCYLTLAALALRAGGGRGRGGGPQDRLHRCRAHQPRIRARRARQQAAGEGVRAARSRSCSAGRARSRRCRASSRRTR